MPLRVVVNFLDLVSFIHLWQFHRLCNYPSINTFLQLDPGLQNAVLRLTTKDEGPLNFEPPSPGKQRRMMRGAEVCQRDRDSNAQGEAAGPDREAEETRGATFIAGLEDVSTKSFRKLIVDMMRRGWHPVKVI